MQKILKKKTNTLKFPFRISISLSEEQINHLQTDILIGKYDSYAQAIRALINHDITRNSMQINQAGRLN